MLCLHNYLADGCIRGQVYFFQLDNFCELSVGSAQEVRVEKEGIERRIEDLAQDAAGLLSTLALHGIVRLNPGPHTPCAILCLWSLVYLLHDLAQQRADMQSHISHKCLVNLEAKATYKTADNSVILLLQMEQVLQSAETYFARCCW